MTTFFVVPWLTDMDTMKKELEEEYQEALLENEKKMQEMQRNYEELLKGQQDKDAVSLWVYCFCAQNTMSLRDFGDTHLIGTILHI